ncbi:HAD family hydrolase [Pseudodonghicola flavimaris]|uniref:HAD-IB family phosphatase n=1 Tax=Pseudodonghicola flavimaris TaxID=3050036 RepID=A0ABT7EWX1_9RHOB|nr:HAD-IB family phosphatase [Pseudodonghicola flavimaris]MDK3016845.1 HAD-IB family phosphatase [Pseudodonghicola flavimaris]
MSISTKPGTAACLHVFDMDGTLLRSTATIELARQMGRLDIGEEIERLWGEGNITDTDFWTNLLGICRDATTADFHAAFHNAPWMEGIAETFADIHARGEAVIVISQSPTFFVRMLELWGAHETYGSAVEPGVPLSDTATLMPEAKVTITEAALTARNLNAHDCVIYGDSSSDMDLFRTFSRTVGVNPSPSLGALAATHYVGTDIREAYALGRQLIGTADRQKPK